MKHILLSLLMLVCSHILYSQENFKYNHILITNDDGIGDADRLLALASEVKKVSKRVSIIVSAFDRSGFSNQTSYGKHQSTLEITCKYYDKKNSISVYEIPGNPADCVLLGLMGFFQEDKPDLVLSGINGGANIGPGWFGSGTIGAIRTSAFLGVPGIALSGFNEEDKKSFTAIPKWVKEFISSDFINIIPKNSYMTIGFPDMNIDEIKGVKIASRRVSFENPDAIKLYQIHGDEPNLPDNKTVWALRFVGDLNNSTTADDTLLNQGYIVITPMTIDENNLVLLQTIRESKVPLPELSND